MKRKKKPKITVWCRYCQYFWDGLPYQHFEKTDKNKLIVKNSRWCEMIGDYVASANKACDEFELATYFWCNKDHNQLRIETCLARQSNRKEGCVRCKQGRQITNLIKEKNI